MAIAAAVVLVVAVLLDQRIEWADGRWPLLTLGGLLGIGAATLVPDRAERTERTEEPGVAALADATRTTTLELPGPGERPGSPVAIEAAAGITAAGFSVAKIGERDDACEDAFAFDLERAVFAVADGASSSFGAREWAHTLAEGFVAAPPAGRAADEVAAWHARMAEQFNARDTSSTEWFNEAAAQRGAHATLLGVRLFRSGGRAMWEAVAAGDSCLLQVRDASLVAAFPMEDGASFGSHPSLVGSAEPEWDGLARFRWATGVVLPGDCLLLMTDAVAEWALSDRQRSAFLGSADLATVQHTLVEGRAAGDLVNDDLTVLKVVLP
jgi:hypothetical protein